MLTSNAKTVLCDCGGILFMNILIFPLRVEWHWDSLPLVILTYCYYKSDMPYDCLNHKTSNNIPILSQKEEITPLYPHPNIHYLTLRVVCDLYITNSSHICVYKARCCINHSPFFQWTQSTMLSFYKKKCAIIVQTTREITVGINVWSIF